MMFLNKLPISPQGQQWMDDGIEYPPDQWYWHWPTIGTRIDSMPEDLERRWELLLIWMQLESYWDQCIRQPKVSSTEYQWVVNYLQSLAAQMHFIVPARLSCFDFAFPLEWCEWDHVWSRYPDVVIQSFVLAGVKLNPTSPLDDERHPCYNEYTSLREHIQQVQERRRVKDIVRGGGAPSSFAED